MSDQVWKYRLRCRATGVQSSYHETITAAVTTAHNRAEYSQEDLEIIRVDGAPLNAFEQREILRENCAAYRMRAAHHKIRHSTCARLANELQAEIDAR